MTTISDDSVTGFQENEHYYGKVGLTKREYFSAMAMQGFVLHYSGYVECNFETKPRETAQRAVEYADALIEELNKET